MESTAQVASPDPDHDDHDDAEHDYLANDVTDHGARPAERLSRRHRGRI
jgi:hypothetical protein